MPSPSTNGHRPDDERRNPTSSGRPSLEELITEAEALRTQLADANPFGGGPEATASPQSRVAERD